MGRFLQKMLPAPQRGVVLVVTMMEPRNLKAVDGLLAAILAVKVVMPHSALLGAVLLGFATLLIGNAFGGEE